jgi:hypothetical protein
VLAVVQDYSPWAGLEMLNSRTADHLLPERAEPGVVARCLVAAGRPLETVVHALEAERRLVDMLGLDEVAGELLDHVLSVGLPRAPHAFELCELPGQLTNRDDEAIPAAVGLMQELANSDDERERVAIALARCLTWVVVDSSTAPDTRQALFDAVPPGSRTASCRSLRWCCPCTCSDIRPVRANRAHSLTKPCGQPRQAWQRC